MSRAAASTIFSVIQNRGDLLLAAAAGTTPTRTYELLADEHRRNLRQFANLRVVKLDEWAGMPMDDPASCETYLQGCLVGPLEISADRYIAFDSNPAVPETECARVRADIARRGPIDLCVLGIGVNGHLGLNEPGDTLQPFAHVASLTEATLSHSMLDESSLRPTCGMTLGMAEILAARQIILLASGMHKSEQLRRLGTERISTHFPASLLWLHPNAVCFCDADAAAGLTDIELARPHRLGQFKTDLLASSQVTK